MNTLIDYLQQHWRAADRLYVEAQAQWQYTFYARLAHFDAKFPISDDGLDEPKPRYTTLDALVGGKRVWVVVPADAAKAERLVTTHLAQRGKVVDVVGGGGTRLYLYDLSQ